MLTYQKNINLSKKINKLNDLKKVELIFSGETISAYIYTNNNKNFWTTLEYNYKTLLRKNTHENFQTFLLEIIKKIKDFSKIISKEYNSAYILFTIFEYLDRAIRPIESWKGANRHVIESLINHLFIKYKAPKFLYKYFSHLSNDETVEALELLFWIAQGQSIKKFPLLPKFERLKNSIHYIFNASEQYFLYEAYRFCQLKSLNVKNEIIPHILASQISIIKKTNTEKEQFIISFMQYFANLEMFDYSRIPEIYDYVNYIKFQYLPIQTPRGYAVYERIQPNFSLTNRNPITLLQQCEEWHAQNNKIQSTKNVTWNPCGIQPFKYKISEHCNYYIQELLSSKQLVQEGQKLKHCVASYANSCYRNQCKIFSMSIHEDLLLTHEKLLTIEINPSTNQIRQIKGHANRQPTQQELIPIKKWATENDLNFSSWMK